MEPIEGCPWRDCAGLYREGYGGPTCKNESRHAGLAARDAKKGG